MSSPTRYVRGQWKTCSYCNQSKEITEFYKTPKGKYGVKSRCKVCYSLFCRIWSVDNKDKKNKINRERLNNNPEAKERVLLSSRIWREKNKDYDAFRASYRRLCKRQACPSWVNKDDLLDIYKEAYYFGLEVDHIVPIISDLVCGLHVPSNLQLLTKSENARKGNRHWPDMP